MGKLLTGFFTCAGIGVFSSMLRIRMLESMASQKACIVKGDIPGVSFSLDGLVFMLVACLDAG